MKQFLIPHEPADSAEPLVLDGKDHHYLVHVRRCRPGDRIPAISPSGGRFVLEMTSYGRYSSTFTVEAARENPGEASEKQTRITLMPAITRGKKFDLTVRQAVEAGAFSICPLLTDHSQVRFQTSSDMAERTERWNRVAEEALQQCGGSLPVQVSLPGKIIGVLEQWNRRGPVLFLHEKKPETGETGYLHGNLAEEVGELAIIIGPEGGLSPGEIRYLTGYGARPIYLGSRVLRAETAALYALAAAGTIIRERAQWQPK